jgi:hypothetical protein
VPIVIAIASNQLRRRGGRAAQSGGTNVTKEFA